MIRMARWTITTDRRRLNDPGVRMNRTMLFVVSPLAWSDHRAVLEQ